MPMPRHCVDASRQVKHVEAGASLSRDAPTSPRRGGGGLTGSGSDGGYSNTAGLAAPHCPLTIKTCVSAGRDESALLWPPLLYRLVYTGNVSGQVYDIIRRSNPHQQYENPVCLNACGSAPLAAFRVQHHFLSVLESLPLREVLGCRGAPVRLLLGTPEFDQVVGFADAYALKAIKKKKQQLRVCSLSRPSNTKRGKWQRFVSMSELMSGRGGAGL